MRNTSLAKFWPLGVLAAVGLLVMIGALIPLHSHPAMRGINPVIMKMQCALPSPASAAGDDSTEASADTTKSYDFDFGGDKNDVVRMGEDIEIGPDQTVFGDVVAIGGRATILGHVRGDVVSIGGGIHLKSGCVVDGDAVVVGGVMDREEGAVVHGQNVSVATFPKGLGKFWWPHMGRNYRTTSSEASVACVWRDTLRYVAFFVVGLILCLALPRRRGVVRSALRARFWMSLLVGFGSMIGLAVGLILLCITCVGILVAIPGFFASLVVIAAAGAVGFALLGELITRREPKDGGAWLWSFALGLLPIFVVQVVGRLLVCSSDGGGTELLGKALLGICKTTWAVLIFAGFGALILSRLGGRDPSLPPPPPLWTGIPGAPFTPGAPMPPGQTPPAYGQGVGQPWNPYGQGGPPQGSPQSGSSQGSGWQPPIPPKPPET
jgi:hypothetical protein